MIQKVVNYNQEEGREKTKRGKRLSNNSKHKLKTKLNS